MMAMEIFELVLVTVRNALVAYFILAGTVMAAALAVMRWRGLDLPDPPARGAGEPDFAARRRAPMVAVFLALVGLLMTGEAGKGPDKTISVLVETVRDILEGERPREPQRGAPGPLPEGWSEMPGGAAVHERWTRYGVNRDVFYMAATNWLFRVRGVPVRGAWVSSGGWLALDRDDGAPAAGNKLSVLAGDFGIVPPMGGRFWHFVTATNSVVFTWEGVFLDRDPAYPVTFQCELLEDGGYAYRYALPDPLADYSCVLTNFTVGATLAGEGGAWPLGGGGQGDGGDGGGPPPITLGDILANPGGVEIRFEGPGDPRPAIDPTNVCFHSTSPHTFTLTGTNGFDGVVTWQYGGQRFEGNPFTLTPDTNAMPGAVTATFTCGGRTFTTNCPAAYCKRMTPCTNAHENCSCETHWCDACEVEYIGEHCCGAGGGGGSRGRVPKGLLRRYHDDFITFYPFGHSDYAAALHGPGFSNCCACAAHSTPPESGPASTNATNRILAFVDSGLLTRGGECATNALPQGSALMPGDPVHVTGLEPSTAPDDRAIRVQWDEGGTTHALTNTFTVASLRIVPDFTGDGSFAGLGSYLEYCYGVAPEGWLLPCEGPPRALHLCTDVKLPGDLTLTLGGDAGAFSVWPTGATNGPPLLSAGKPCATNGAPVAFAAKGGVSEVHAAPLAPGTAEVTYRFEGSGVASNVTCSHTLPLTAVRRTLEPVTTGTAPGGTAIVNPAAVPQGELAMYAI
ncbi:MAG: hypothetical protein FWG50_12230, partial [Kiritimatiellaeota bacterium]|nr:hypothetical protein [Kiritimatiellota bacterium]